MVPAQAHWRGQCKQRRASEGVTALLPLSSSRTQGAALGESPCSPAACGSDRAAPPPAPSRISFMGCELLSLAASAYRLIYNPHLNLIAPPSP